MNYSEQYKEHIEYTFAAFCKIVLRNTALSAYRDIGRRRKWETSLDYLMEEKHYKPSTTDSYFEEQPTRFVVCGEIIEIKNEQLAKAFSSLPELRQEVLVLYYFFHYTDKRIGEAYGRSRTTANYWKLSSLKRLRKELERLEHEERKADTV
ncbi:RNA polymerase sigma factor [Lachnoclostridium edouardi]|uniref:RNA polymerase sigma factor n=1 Tax=Lachnoclostridium edouardi TaxID=1926283 RepID=UPI000C7D7165|nr:sigma-70 family RNA polymerase sigma factor [Lachnoclostridium edouardi]